MKTTTFNIIIFVIALLFLGFVVTSIVSCHPAYANVRHYPELSDHSTNCDNLATMKEFNGHDIVIVGCSGDRCAFHSPDCKKCN
jgi:hypothetical protein